MLLCAAIALPIKAYSAEQIFEGTYQGVQKPTKNGGVGFINTGDSAIVKAGTQFINNEAYRGAGIYNYADGNLTVEDNVRFDNNRAVGAAGGAIQNFGTATMGDNLIFENNTAKWGGAAIYAGSNSNSGHSTTIGSGAIFRNNTLTDSASYGGAIFIENDNNADTATFNLGSNSTFEKNSAMEGGAIYIKNAVDAAIADGATFTNNTATSAGGALYNIGNTTITNASFNNNSANSYGGSVYNNGAMTVGGNFSDSSAKQGGAIYNAKELTVLDGTTFNNNSATVTGSAISNYAEKLVIGDNVKFTNNTCLMENPPEVSPMTQMGTIYSEGTADRQNNITIGNNVTFENNKSGAGSGMYLYGNNKVTVGDNAQFINNTTQKSLTDTTPTSGGGAITLVSGSNGAARLEIGDNARFEGNKAMYAGAINVNSANSSLIIGEAAQFINNKAEGNVGGAIYNNGNTTIAEGATFAGNSALAGGAIFTTKDMELTDATFINNSADKEGGAIYTSSNNLILNAVDKDIVMAGNKATKGGDIFMKKEGANLNLNAFLPEGDGELEEHTITIASGISGNNYNMNINTEANALGTVVVNSAIQNAAINVQQGALHLAEGSGLVDSSLTVQGGATLDTTNNQLDTFGNNVTLEDGALVAADINIQTGKADNFAGAQVGNSVMLDDLNPIMGSLSESTSINLKEALGIDSLVIPEDAIGEQAVMMSSIRRFYGSVTEDGMLNFVPTGNGYKDFNPGVMASPIAAQLGGYLTQLNSYDQAFRNMDMYMLMTKKQREAMKLRNKYAAADGNLVFDPTGSAYDDKAVWVRPYATFENVPLKGGPRVSNVAYGSFFGADSELYDLGHGWDGMLSVYAGYNGSHQAYDGIGIYQNGGTLGLTGMAYKGNFFTGLTLNAGANVGEANTAFGNDNFSMLMAGIANKTGYNIEFADGKFIIQPNVQLSYSFVNTFDYTNAAGVRMNSDPLNAIQVEPGIKFIGNLKNGWQPYAGVSMVWNIMDKTNFHANNVSLPELSVKPYVRYGVGVRKTWGEVCTGFFQTYFTNGGRNGVGLQGGFRFTLGKGGLASLKTSNNMPELPATKINLSSAR